MTAASSCGELELLSLYISSWLAPNAYRKDGDTLSFAPHVQARSLASTNISAILTSWVSSLAAHHELKCRIGEVR